MTGAEQAEKHFRDGCCCSQAVLLTYAEPLGLSREHAAKIAAGFCGGIGGKAETCGAVTGAVMVIGLKYAGPDSVERTRRGRTLEIVREFLQEFTARNGSIICRGLLGCDISTPEGEKARQLGLFTTICPRLVRSAGEILDDMLDRRPV